MSDLLTVESAKAYVRSYHALHWPCDVEITSAELTTCDGTAAPMVRLQTLANGHRHQWDVWTECGELYGEF